MVVSRETRSGGSVMLAVVEPAERSALLRATGLEPVGTEEREENPGLRDVRARLERHGASADLVQRVLRSVERSGAQGPYAIDAAAKVLGEAFPVAPSPSVGGPPRLIAFVGPTGVGKTTTLAKLAIALVQAGRRVALATTDTFRVGAVDQVRTYAELIEAPFHVARDGVELARKVEEAGPVDVVLVDTTGRSPRDAEQLERLASSLRGAGEASPLTTYLVLAATSRPHDLDEIARGFAGTSPDGVIVTKLDETAGPTGALEYTAYSGLPIAFLCDGQDVREHLHRPHPGRLADVVLRGRVA
jgi:flagellar biosynthesis protein FlhF